MKKLFENNISLIAALVATSCCIFMFWLGWDMGEKSYQIQDTTLYSEVDLKSSYKEGFNTGLNEALDMTMASHTEIVESWACNIQSITINNNTIHIIDGNGEEWILLSDNYK